PPDRSHSSCAVATGALIIWPAQPVSVNVSSKRPNPANIALPIGPSPTERNAQDAVDGSRDASTGSVAGRHEGIAEIGRRHDRFLDRARAHPAQEIQHAPRLVVRPRGAGTAEGLLAHAGARRPVGPVKVAPGVP